MDDDTQLGTVTLADRAALAIEHLRLLQDERGSLGPRELQAVVHAHTLHAPGGAVGTCDMADFAQLGAVVVGALGL